MKKTIVTLSAALIIAALLAVPAKAQIQLEVGGYLQTWYIADQKTELEEDTEIRTSGFRLRRSRLTARGTLNETFSATTWLDFASGTNPLLDFHMDARIRPWLNFRAGQFIMPGQSFDTARLVSSRLYFYERPGVTTALASGMGYSAFRDIGVMLYGNYGGLWYGVHAGNGSGRFTQAGTQITERDAFGGLYGARADYTFGSGISLGGHISINQQRNVVQSGTGPFDIDRTSWSLRFHTDGFLADRLYTQFEYMQMLVRDDSRGVTVTDDENYDLHGFYAEAGYGITIEWHVLARYDQMVQKPGQSGILQGVDRFEGDRITFGVTRYVFHENREIARFYLNYNFGEDRPGNLGSHALVLVMQLRFIPI